MFIKNNKIKPITPKEMSQVSLSNGEIIQYMTEKIDVPLYFFSGNKYEFYLRFDKDKGFIICNTLKEVYDTSFENNKLDNILFKTPNIKKYAYTLKYIHCPDNVNIFEIYGNLKIGHINTTFMKIPNPNKPNEYIVTKDPEYTEYLLFYDNIQSVLTYHSSYGYVITNSKSNDLC